MSTRTAKRSSLEEQIGRTPMMPLRRVAAAGGADVYVKLESSNPGGSVMDRAARAIIRAAEASGQLAAGRTLIDASAGNTGIAYAMLCAERGYGCEICMPSGVSDDRRALLARYGATVVLTARGGMAEAIAEARRRAELEPARYYFANQYGNPENARAHYETTGVEIWQQTSRQVAAFVTGLGTAGTFMGTGRRLREYNGKVKLVALYPDVPTHGITGLQIPEENGAFGLYDAALADATVTVRTSDAKEMVHRLLREEGLVTGISGGANVWAAVRIAARLKPGQWVVTILPDGGERYLNERWWEETVA